MLRELTMENTSSKLEQSQIIWKASTEQRFLKNVSDVKDKVCTMSDLPESYTNIVNPYLTRK